MEPVEVSGDNRLILNQDAMQMHKEYHFRFLDTDMVAIRTVSGIDLYQIDLYQELREG